MPPAFSPSDLPPWEDVLLYSLSIDTRKRFEEAVQAAKADRRKKTAIGDDFVFYQGNKTALPREEFCDFFKRLLIKGFAILQSEQERISASSKDRRATLSKSSSGSFPAAGTGFTNNNDNDDNDDDDDYDDADGLLGGSSSFFSSGRGGLLSMPMKKSTPKVSILATALEKLNSQARQSQAKQQQQTSKSNTMMAMSNLNASLNSNASITSTTLLLLPQQQQYQQQHQQQSYYAKKNLLSGSVDPDVLVKDLAFRPVIASIDRFLDMFFTLVDAEKSGRVDWDRVVSMVEEVISAGGIKNLAGHRFDVDGNPLQLQEPSVSGVFLPTSTSASKFENGLDNNDNDNSNNTNNYSTRKSSAFLDESKAVSEHESTVGLACASMRVLRVMRFVGERNRTILPSAKMQLELIKSRLNEAEAVAALSSRIKDPVQAVIAPYAGAPPTRGEFGGSILAPPPMYNASAVALRPPICNTNQARIVLETPFQPSLQQACTVQPFAASTVSRLTYQPSCGLFTALCKEVNEVRFVGESQAFLQRLSLKEESKIESVCLWHTVASSKAMAHGAGTIFESCAYSCFLGLLDGTVQLYSLRDTRIGPGMRNISLRLQTQVPSGYVVCSMHVPFAKPSSVLSGTSTGDLIHWNFDPHIVDDFMGGGGASGAEVTTVQAVALRKLMVLRRTIHEGPIIDLCTLGDVKAIDLSQFRHPDDITPNRSNSTTSINDNTNSTTFGGAFNSLHPSADQPSSNSNGASTTKNNNTNSNSNSNKSPTADCNVVTVGFDGFACVSDVCAPTALRRFSHSAGLLCCASITDSIFSSAGFVSEPHIWDVRAGSSTKPTMKLHDPRRPHLASVTSLSVMSHLLPQNNNTSSNISNNININNNAQSSTSSVALLPPLISCDSVGRMNVWDLRVGKTLSSFDIHDLIDDATEALPCDQRKTANRARNNATSSSSSSSSSVARRRRTTSSSSSSLPSPATGSCDDLSALSLKEHRFCGDSCRATISRKTGRIFVTSESRSSVAEFGSVTPVGQDPRGCFPSDAILCISYIASLRVIVTCHVDVVIVWELSRSFDNDDDIVARKKKKNAMMTKLKQQQQQQQQRRQSNNNSDENDIDNEPQRQDENIYDDDDDDDDNNGDNSNDAAGGDASAKQKSTLTNIERCPFTVGELHEFPAPDIEAAAAQAAREKVLFRDKNTTKPLICHQLYAKERLTCFTLHSRGNQYAVGTNQGRIFVCRTRGGEILFQAEKSVHPKPNTEIRWISSASAPSVYSGLQSNASESASDRLGNLVSVSPSKGKKAAQANFGFEGREASGSFEFSDDDNDNGAGDAATRERKRQRRDIEQIRPRAHLQQKTLLQDDTIVSIGSDDSVLCVHTMRQQIIQIYPKGGPLACSVSRHDVLAVMCDDAPFFYFCDPLAASAVPVVPKPELRHREVRYPMTAMTTAPWLNVAFLGDSVGVLHCMAVKPHPLAEAGKDAHLYSADFECGNNDNISGNVNPNSPAICSVACHHVGAQTLQEFTLVVAGDDVGRVGWWRAMGEIEVIGDKQKEKIHRRRSSLSGGALMTPTMMDELVGGDATDNDTKHAGVSRLGTKKVSFLDVRGRSESDDNDNNNRNAIGSTRKHSNATLSQFTSGEQQQQQQHISNNPPPVSSSSDFAAVVSFVGDDADASDHDESCSPPNRRRRRSSTSDTFGHSTTSNLSRTSSSATAKKSQAHGRQQQHQQQQHKLPKYYVKPTLYWQKSCKFHEGRIVSLSIFTKHDTDYSGLAAIWIAAAGADGRVSLVRASTGEFIALLSASPASRLSALMDGSSVALSSSSSKEGNSFASRAAAASAAASLGGGGSQNMMFSASQRRQLLVSSGGKVGGGVFEDDGRDSESQTHNAGGGASLKRPGGFFLTSTSFAHSAAKTFLSKSSATGAASRKRSVLTSSRRDPSKLVEGTKRNFPINFLFWMRRFMHNCRKRVHERKERERNVLSFVGGVGVGVGVGGGIGRSGSANRDTQHTNQGTTFVMQQSFNINSTDVNLGSTFSRRFSEALGVLDHARSAMEESGMFKAFHDDDHVDDVEDDFNKFCRDDDDDDDGNDGGDDGDGDTNTVVGTDDGVRDSSEADEREGEDDVVPPTSEQGSVVRRPSDAEGGVRRSVSFGDRGEKPAKRAKRRVRTRGNAEAARTDSYSSSSFGQADSALLAQVRQKRKDSFVTGNQTLDSFVSSSKSPRTKRNSNKFITFATDGDSPSKTPPNELETTKSRKLNRSQEDEEREKTSDGDDYEEACAEKDEEGEVEHHHRHRQQYQQVDQLVQSQTDEPPPFADSSTSTRPRHSDDEDDDDLHSRHHHRQQQHGPYFPSSADPLDSTSPNMPSATNQLSSTVSTQETTETTATTMNNRQVPLQNSPGIRIFNNRDSSETASPAAIAAGHYATNAVSPTRSSGALGYTTSATPTKTAPTTTSSRNNNDNRNSTGFDQYSITLSTTQTLFAGGSVVGGSSRSPSASNAAAGATCSAGSQSLAFLRQHDLGSTSAVNAHFGQTYSGFLGSTTTMRAAAPKRTKITFEEMKSMHRFRTMRATTAIEQQIQQQEEEHQQRNKQQEVASYSLPSSSPVVQSNSSNIKNKNGGVVSRLQQQYQHEFALAAPPAINDTIIEVRSPTTATAPQKHIHIQTGPLLAGPTELGVEISEFLPSDRDRAEMEIFDDNDDEGGYGHHKFVGPFEEIQDAQFYDGFSQTQQEKNDESSSVSRSRSRSTRNDGSAGGGDSDDAGDDGHECDNSGNNEGDKRRNRSDRKPSPHVQRFIRLSTQRRVPHRPTSARVESMIEDVVGNRFLLPESRERLGRRFAQSIVVSTGQRSYIPLSAQSIAQNTSRRPLSAGIGTMHRGPATSATSASFSNGGTSLTNRNKNDGIPPAAPTHLSPSTTSTLHKMNIITDLTSPSTVVGMQGTTTPATKTRPSSAVAAVSAATTSFAIRSSARARNQYRHYGEQQIVRPVSSASQLSTTSNSSQQQQNHIKRVIEKIVNDPDSDMATKIQPPATGEVSARRTSDVLRHTSARTNELVLRKVAVENEAQRYRFKYDVESRTKREQLLNRVSKMGECIDEALTPTTLNSVLSNATKTKRLGQTIGTNNNNSNDNNKRGGDDQSTNQGRNWTPTPELVAWMSAPKSGGSGLLHK